MFIKKKLSKKGYILPFIVKGKSHFMGISFFNCYIFNGEEKYKIKYDNVQTK